MITVSGGEGEPGVFDGPGLDGWVVGGRVVRGFVLSPYNLVPGDWVFGIIVLFAFFPFWNFPRSVFLPAGKSLYEIGLTWTIYEGKWLSYVMVGGGLVAMSFGGFLLVGKSKKTKSLSQTNVWEEARGRRTGAGGQLLAGITCAEYEYCKIRKKKRENGVGGRKEGGRKGSYYRERNYHIVLLLYCNQPKLFVTLIHALTTTLVPEFS